MAVNRNDPNNLFLKLALFAILGLAAGFYLLEEVASWEKVPLGQVFYIVVGCVLIAASAIIMFLAVKKRYRPKRKKKSSKPVFLKDSHQKSHSK